MGYFISISYVENSPFLSILELGPTLSVLRVVILPVALSMLPYVLGEAMPAAASQVLWEARVDPC